MTDKPFLAAFLVAVHGMHLSGAVARRIAALLQLRERLDANWQAASARTVAFKAKP